MEQPVGHEIKEQGLSSGAFENKVALVTGASKGIGLAAVRQFAQVEAMVKATIDTFGRLDAA